MTVAVAEDISVTFSLQYKHFSCLNLAEVTSKNYSKSFKVTQADGTTRYRPTEILAIR